MAADWSSHTEAPLSINSSSPSREMLTHSWVSIIPEKKIPHQGAGTGPGSGEPAISPPPHLQMGSGTGTQGLPSSCHVFLPISSLLPFKKKKKTISIFCHPSPVRVQLSSSQTIITTEHKKLHVLPLPISHPVVRLGVSQHLHPTSPKHSPLATSQRGL